MNTKTNKKAREDVHGGLILVAIGLFFLVGRYINLGDNFGLLIMPALGAIFMIAGILKRDGGLMVPGGILSGIGVGILLLQAPFAQSANFEDGGLFLLSLGTGFASIAVFSALFAKETHWWSLIPASILWIIGLGVGFGGIFLRILELAGTYWPLILIGAGAFTIYQAMREPKLKEKFVE